MIGFFGTFTVILVLLILALVGMSIFFSVRQQTNVIIERFGRFHRIALPGLRVKVPFIDRKAGVSDLRIQQLDLVVDTKTKDNVFVNIAVSVQYHVNPDAVYDAFYKLSDHKKQIASYVYDSIRSTVPTLVLDDVFEKKDNIASQVAETIGEEMSGFGYNIIKTLVSDIDPNENVKVAMNNINAAQRERVAAQELANAEKIKTVTNAQAHAEAQELQGVGIAKQREAIIKGFSDSLEGLEEHGIDTSHVVQIILFTQYLDTLADMGKSGTNTLLMPSNPAGMDALMNQIQVGAFTGNTLSEAVNSEANKVDPTKVQTQSRQVLPQEIQ